MSTYKFRNSPEIRTTTGLDFGTLVQQGNSLLHTYGTANLFLGTNSGNYTLTGTNNVGQGRQVCSNLTTGSYNVGLGDQALQETQIGTGNVAMGAYALQGNFITTPTGSYNAVVGTESLLFYTSASYNTTLGYRALCYGTTPTACVAIGGNSMRGDGVTPPTGSNNTGIGADTLYNLTTGSKNVAVGYFAMRSIGGGLENVAVGSNALQDTTGNRNVGVGQESLTFNQGGAQNVAIGYVSLANNRSGDDNVAVGFDTIRYSRTTDGNTAVGTSSLRGNTGTIPTGVRNCAMGFSAAEDYTTASDMVAIGHNSLLLINTGSTNTALGSGSGHDLVTGSGNVFLGYQAGYSETGSNTLYISNSNTATPLIYGNFATPAATINGDLTVTEEFIFEMGADNASTGTLNDVSTAGTSFMRFTGAGTVYITGFANGVDGKTLTIVNRTGYDLTLENENAGSVAANRIITGKSASMVLLNGAAISLQYDATTARWNACGDSSSGENISMKSRSWMGF